MKSIINWLFVRIWGHKPFKKSPVGVNPLVKFLKWRAHQHKIMLESGNYVVLHSNF